MNQIQIEISYVIFIFFWVYNFCPAPYFPSITWVRKLVNQISQALPISFYPPKFDQALYQEDFAGNVTYGYLLTNKTIKG